ncbi:hypothetical protein BDW_12310 [Bdellovibrio bacteriovorus W]|nr:hypothetical protein BDW_12310 [Bdellovibrio bacteriovorus W]
MKKIIHCSLSVIITLSSLGAHANDPREQARAQIAKTKEQAQTYASDLVSADFSEALLDVMAEALRAGSPGDAFQVYMNDIASMEERVLGILDRVQQKSQNISSETLLALWEEHKNAVRKRFEISYQVQNQIYEQSLFISAAENALSRFKNVCETGRSQKGIKFYNQLIPNLPPIHSEINLQFNVGEQGGLSRISSQSSSSSGNDKDSQVISTSLNTAAGLSTSIAAAGGAGQLVAACTMAAPYLVAAAVVYSVVASAIAADEQRRAQDRIAEANVMMFRDSASDGDVAMYYRETCQTLRPLITSLQQKLQMIKRDDNERLLTIQAASALRVEIEAFENASAIQEQNMKYLRLYQATRADICKPRYELAENPTCFRNATHIILASDDKVQLPLDEKERFSIIEPMEKSLKDFAKSYPKEKRAELVGAKLVLALGPQWNQTALSLHRMSFEVVDSLMASLFQKIQILFSQYRTDQNALWNKSEASLEGELKAIKAFEDLKTTHRKLVNDGIKVIFNRHSKEVFQNEVALHVQKARNFSDSYKQHREVKSFMTSVDALARLYKNL